MNWTLLLASSALVAVALQNAVVIVDNQVWVWDSPGQPSNKKTQGVSGDPLTDIKDGSRPVSLGGTGTGIAFAVDHSRSAVNHQTAGWFGVGAVDTLVAEVWSVFNVSPEAVSLLLNGRILTRPREDPPAGVRSCF